MRVWCRAYRWGRVVAGMAAVLWMLGSLAPPEANALLFDLFDHGEGTEGPHYGLRLDGEDLFFSVEDEDGNSRVTLDWVPGSDEALISGTLREVNPATNASAGDTSVTYLLSGLTSVFDGGLIGFEATMGEGSLGGGAIPLEGKAEMGSDVVFRFLADGFRLPGDDSTAVGRGWVEGNRGLNDWLVKSDGVIPEPGTALLLGVGLVALGLRRRTTSRRGPPASS